ncbi:hypothetical protein HY570_01780, partial [Candidatus Micrarchaeota archaeon]|nr:hypothetical protein [Candidatus Micrarchaeota archaeon]
IFGVSIIFECLVAKHGKDLKITPYEVGLLDRQTIQRLIEQEFIVEVRIKEVARRLGIIVGDYLDHKVKVSRLKYGELSLEFRFYEKFAIPEVLNSALAKPELDVLEVIEVLGDVANGRGMIFMGNQEAAREMLELLTGSPNNEVGVRAKQALEGKRHGGGGFIKFEPPQRHKLGILRLNEDPTVRGCRNRQPPRNIL